MAARKVAPPLLVRANYAQTEATLEPFELEPTG